MQKRMLPIIALTICLGCNTSQTPQVGEQGDASGFEPTTDVSFQGDTVSQRETFLKENIATLAGQEFPDNTANEWNIHGFKHQDHLTFVEVEPKPADVGYPRFKFAVSFQDANQPIVVGTYCFEDGHFTLLSTIKDLTDDLPESL